MIHRAKSNPLLLDEQIFSERLESAISALGTFATCPISPRMSAVGADRTPAVDGQDGAKTQSEAH